MSEPLKSLAKEVEASVELCKTWPWSDGAMVPVVVANGVYMVYLSGRKNPRSKKYAKYRLFNLQRLKTEFNKMGMEVQLNRKKFAAIIIRTRMPRMSVLIFDEGKIVCTGAKSLPQARYIVYNVVERIRMIAEYTSVYIRQIRNVNMVACTNLKWTLPLRRIEHAYSDFCTYNSKRFPGAIIRPPQIAPMAALVFRQGKMVMTGATNIGQVEMGMNVVPALLKDYANLPDLDEVEALPVEIKLEPNDMEFESYLIEQIGELFAEDDDALP